MSFFFIADFRFEISSLFISCGIVPCVCSQKMRRHIFYPSFSIHHFQFIIFYSSPIKSHYFKSQKYNKFKLIQTFNTNCHTFSIMFHWFPKQISDMIPIWLITFLQNLCHIFTNHKFKILIVFNVSLHPSIFFNFITIDHFNCG